jgi:hypothetical protein
MSRSELGRRIKAGALEFVERICPQVREQIRLLADRSCPQGPSHRGPCEFHDPARQVRDALSTVVDLLTKFALETPETATERGDMVVQIRTAYDEFKRRLEGFGRTVSLSPFFITAMTDALGQEVRRVADYLNESE